MRTNHRHAHPVALAAGLGLCALLLGGCVDGVINGAKPGGAAGGNEDMDEPDVPGTGLTYHKPPAGGKVRLEKNPASTPTLAVLDLVVGDAPLNGFGVGMNLPLDAAKVALAAQDGFVPGSALPPGSAPVAARALLPTAGPLAGVLVSGQSQKSAGAGAVPADSSLPAGTLLYTLRLAVVPGAPTGVVFDGKALGPRFRAALRDKPGNDVAGQADFRIGRLMNN